MLFLKNTSNILQMWNLTEKWSFGSGYEHMRWSWCCYNSPVKCRTTGKPGGSWKEPEVLRCNSDERCVKCEWNRKDLKEEGGRAAVTALSSFIQVWVAWRKDRVWRGLYRCCPCCGWSLAKQKALTKEQICRWHIFLICVLPTPEWYLLI